MVELNTPLKYHMNDLVYYLGLSTGGNLGKQIAYLGAISAMMQGMLYSQKDMTVKAEIEAFAVGVDIVDKAYMPMMDSSPYMYVKARRIRKAIHILEVMAYHIITDQNLIAGNIMRARLAEAFGKNRIKGMEGEYAEQ